MKIPSRLVPWTLGLACVLALAAGPAFAADMEPPSDAPEASAVVTQAPVDAPATSIATPEPLPTAGTLGNCRVRCGFQFYWYSGFTESQCCNETVYCPDGSIGNAVAFQPYGGVAERCAP
jgi:hypothetical protein